MIDIPPTAQELAIHAHDGHANSSVETLDGLTNLLFDPRLLDRQRMLSGPGRSELDSVVDIGLDGDGEGRLRSLETAADDGSEGQRVGRRSGFRQSRREKENQERQR